MLQNLSDLTRLQRGASRVDPQEVNLAEVVDEAIFNVRDAFAPEVILEKRLASPLPKVRTDLGKLNQILFHLLDNAAKFTRHGRIELAVCVEDMQLKCSVKDTGIGIASDDEAQIFEEFFQVDSSPASQHRGAGLGLTLTRALVEQLGGSISLTTEVGKGSCFSVSLPVGVS